MYVYPNYKLIARESEIADISFWDESSERKKSVEPGAS